MSELRLVCFLIKNEIYVLVEGTVTPDTNPQGNQGTDSPEQDSTVTTLTKRYLPLIRYRIGDYMSDVRTRSDGSVSDFLEVSGRAGDVIDMGNGVRFHGYSLMVCAEENPKIVAYQLKVNKSIGVVTFVAQTISPLTEAEKVKIKYHAADVASIEATKIRVEEAAELVKAPSGKIRLVLEEE